MKNSHTNFVLLSAVYIIIVVLIIASSILSQVYEQVISVTVLTTCGIYIQNKIFNLK